MQVVPRFNLFLDLARISRVILGGKIIDWSVRFSVSSQKLSFKCSDLPRVLD
jgi:hypothetical protein